MSVNALTSGANNSIRSSFSHPGLGLRLYLSFPFDDH